MKYRLFVETVSGEIYVHTVENKSVATEAALGLVVDQAYANHMIEDKPPYTFIPHHQIKKITVEEV